GCSVEDVPGLPAPVPILERFAENPKHLGGQDVLQRWISELKGQVLSELQLKGVRAGCVILPAPLDLRMAKQHEAQGLLLGCAPAGVDDHVTLKIAGGERAESGRNLQSD